MYYDDRLTTVLAQAAGSPHARAVQWRQLVELLARGAGSSDWDLRQQALDRVRALRLEVPVEVRASAARAVAASDLPLEVVELFTADTIEVAAPVIAAAVLDEAGWRRLRQSASPSVLTMIDAFQVPATDRPLPLPTYVPPEFKRPEKTVPVTLPPTAEVPVATPEEQAHAPAYAGLFRWECGPSGEIEWVEGAPRAALIGRNIAEEVANSFKEHLPFEQVRLSLAEAGAMAGDWRLSGSPAFVPGEGRFAGYRGVAERVEPRSEQRSYEEEPSFLGGDSLRELVHELRTPLNAIIGFGEIIDGQFLGPAHQPYRQRAGEIVRQARRLLDAVEDLDFTAKLQSGRARAGGSVGWRDLVQIARDTIGKQAAARGVLLALSIRSADERCPLPPDLAERLVSRFGSAVLALAWEGERMELVVESVEGRLAVALERPQATIGWSDAQLLGAGAPAESDGLGASFPLRLVRGLAAVTGGRLDVTPDRLILLLPRSDR